MKYKRILMNVCLIVLAALTVTNSAFAGASGANAKGYIAAPQGLSGILLYSHYSSANETYLNGQENEAYEDFKVDQTTWVCRPVYYFGIGSFTATIQALVPFADVSLDATLKTQAGPFSISESRSGLADPTILGAVWLINNPKSKTWLGISEWVNMPFGKYDNERILNIGDNRWGFKTELGFVKGFGNFYVDLIPKVEIFTNNDDHRFSDGSVVTSEKDPVYGFEGHLSYDFIAGHSPLSLALDYNYAKGGEETIRDVEQNKEMDDHALQLSLTYGLTPNQKLLFQFQKDLEVENGPKGHKFGLRYTLLFF